MISFSFPISISAKHNRPALAKRNKNRFDSLIFTSYDLCPPPHSTRHKNCRFSVSYSVKLFCGYKFAQIAFNYDTRTMIKFTPLKPAIINFSCNFKNFEGHSNP